MQQCTARALQPLRLCQAGPKRFVKHPAKHSFWRRACAAQPTLAPAAVAAERGENHVVKMLLEYKADPTPKDVNGNTPLLEAIRNEHVTAARYIFSAGGRLGFADDRVADLRELHAGDVTPASELCHATFRRQTEYVRKLLEFGANVNSQDYYDAKASSASRMLFQRSVIACMKWRRSGPAAPPARPPRPAPRLAPSARRCGPASLALACGPHRRSPGPRTVPRPLRATTDVRLLPATAAR